MPLAEMPGHWILVSTHDFMDVFVFVYGQHLSAALGTIQFNT